MATLLRKLTLRLGDAQYECQLNIAEVTDEPTTEEFTSFCGTETFATSAYKLHLAGAQDWSDVDSLCDLIHDAYVTEPVAELDFEVALGGNPDATPPVPHTHFRSGKAKPTQDVPFGGTAGSPLTFDQTLDVIGQPAETPLA
jgi:hypothetical protein